MTGVQTCALPIWCLVGSEALKIGIKQGDQGKISTLKRDNEAERISHLCKLSCVEEMISGSLFLVL